MKTNSSPPTHALILKIERNKHYCLPHILLTFQNWCCTLSLYTANEMPKLIDRFFYFTKLFASSCNSWVLLTICFDFAKMPHAIAGNFFAWPHGRLRCHIWTQTVYDSLVVLRNVDLAKYVISVTATLI